MKKTSALFGLLAFALLAYGGYDCFVDLTARQDEHDVVLRVPEADQIVGERTFATQRFRFRIENKSRRTVRVAGISSSCAEECCMGPVNMEPFQISARGVAEIECEAKPNKAGPFQCRVYVQYYDRGTYQQFPVTIRGTWIAPTTTEAKAGDVVSR
jgi:hypothetical protein